jgi:ABC-2 type transport system ATP-binding protein
MRRILEITDLTKDYGDFLLDKVSFLIPQGAIMGLIGENGAGKTTTINIILNEISKDGGSVSIFEKDHLQCETEIKNAVGVVFDDSPLPDLFTVVEFEKVLSCIYSAWEHRTFEQYIKKFELPASKPIKNFSRGMKVKLCFAIALSHNSKLLILDEATSGLDPIMRDEIMDILLDFVQDENHSILFSSHITNDLEKIADYITFIHKGKILFSKTKDELIYHYGIIHCGAACFDSLDKSEIIAYRKQDYEWQVLVADRDTAQKKYKNCVVDNATLDDIMLFYVKGEKQ